MIVIAGFGETEANSGEHVGRVTGIPSLFTSKNRPGPEAGKVDPARDVDSPFSTPDMMKVWTILGLLTIPGAAVIVGPQPPSSGSPIS
jgi:hypothetical protein